MPELLVSVYCEECWKLKESNPNPVFDVTEMKVTGPLIYNPESYVQSQDYKCPTCSKVVKIVIQQKF